MKRARGFTLLETLLALTVFVGSFALLLQSMGGAMRMTRISGEIAEATMWAQNTLDTLGLEKPLKAGRESGRFGDKYRYELEVREYIPIDSAIKPDPSFPVQLFRVELKVIWGQAPFVRSEVFTTLKSRTRDGSFF
jgi:type II secretory pathway pseudopilin PulG